MWTWAAAVVFGLLAVTFGGSSGMAEDTVLAVRGMIFGGDLDLLKGLITEHDIPVEDIEAITKTQAVTLVDDDEFRFNDASTHEGHLRQNGELTWLCSETIIM